MAGERLADRFAQHALDGVLGEVARGGQQRGVVEQADRAGDPHPGTLLGREGSGGELPHDLVPDLAEIGVTLRHPRTPPGRWMDPGPLGVHKVVHSCA